MAKRQAHKETTEEELRAVTVGELTPVNEAIVLAEYDPRWPSLYDREAAQIRATLGEDVKLLEHVGSTSVVGLVGKPVIDIILAVRDSADEPAYRPRLEAAGYVLRIREPEWCEHRVFKGARVDVNLHVFSAGCPETEKMLRFRDRLRESKECRDVYAAAKRQLAGQTWKFVQNYADAKSAVVQQILQSSLSRDTRGEPTNR